MDDKKKNLGNKIVIISKHKLHHSDYSGNEMSDRCVRKGHIARCEVEGCG